ncbi:MAG TPA: hypothetical protein VM889_09250 [Candidatus Thermoplasmatota archaeon]|nr:hypothetical protein [Candidatus Thermoplasmatota archaeon]
MLIMTSGDVGADKENVNLAGASCAPILLLDATHWGAPCRNPDAEYDMGSAGSPTPEGGLYHKQSDGNLYVGGTHHSVGPKAYNSHVEGHCIPLITYRYDSTEWERCLSCPP